MKKQISFLTILFSFSIITMIFISCAKEEIVPFSTAKTSLDATASAADESVTNSAVSLFLENALKTGETPDADVTVSEVMERLSLDENSRWGVDIQAFACVRTGHSLLVYNPNNPSLDFYASRKFLTLWFKDGRPLRTNNVRLECMCRGKYTAIVLNKATQQGVGIAFHSLGACLADDFSVATDNN